MSKTLDNIGTAMAPTWRARRRAPFTVHAVRMELVAQAAELPEWERESYIDGRLTDLDRALSCDEALALEHWLDCEEMLQGSAKTVDWDGGGGGGGRTSPVPDEAMEALAEHARVKANMGRYKLAILGRLAKMMGEPHWEFVGYFVNDVRRAAAELTKLHSSMHT